MKNVSIFLLLAVPVAFPLHAASRTVVSSEGDTYYATENANGGILTSKYPRPRYIEQGAASHVIDGKEVIYFGRSCDAFTKAYSVGTWGWANGGFVATFNNGARIGFPRQDPPWDDLLQCRL
ncbi:MAG: hypothetical protein GC186_17335 [Rhodobacteraceae bacterium]|nr:hypothetical protein [Paracoccaceae bacterium]